MPHLFRKALCKFSVPFFFNNDLIFFSLFRSTLNARRLFEELISRHAAEVKRDNAMLRGQRVKLVGHQRVKARRPKSKPDSVIQRLLERFDPLKLNSTNNSRLY